MAPVIRGNSLYTIVDGPSWTQAEAKSVKLGGHLVTIDDENENEWIFETFKDLAIDRVIKNGYSGTKVNMFIGFNDAGTEGQYAWSSGGNSGYRNWATGQPQNAYSDEDFAGIFVNWGATSEWHDIVSDYRFEDENVGIAEIPFIQRGDSIYVIVQGPTWEEAEANAQALGGHLVTINDAEENEWLYNNFGIGNWIGLSDKEVEGVFTWASGDNSSFRNWAAGEPSNSGDIQDYAWMQYAQGFWDDLQNDPNVNRGIAEIRLSDLGIVSTPTPPTLQSTTATKNQLILTFSEDLQVAGGGALDTSLLTVTVDGRTRRITRAQINPDNASEVLVTVSGRSPFFASSLDVAYKTSTAPENKGALVSSSGTAVETIAPLAIDTYATSINIFSSGISENYKNLLLTGSAVKGYGNSKDNTLTGNDANNTLDGLGGADTLLGGKGNDTYVVDNAADVVTELADEGTDTVQSSISYTLGEHLENLTLIGKGNIDGNGNSTNNTITGNDGANILNGNGGADTLIGGRGNDTYMVNSIDDVIKENGWSSDIDNVVASIDWTLVAKLENLTLTGSDAINGTGNTDDNIIVGNNAANILDGGNGGKDILTGAGGSDIFAFSSRPQRFRSNQADHITDFSSTEGDKIQITKRALGITASTVSLGIANGAAEVNRALSTSSLFVYDTSNGELHWNQNGTGRGAGTGGVFAVFDNRATLSGGDFTLI
jgi:Ca2+-binding RTX toxin-like protein